MPPPQRTALKRFPKWAIWILFLWFLLGSLPMLAPRIGYSFLPSPDWAARSNIFAHIGGGVLTVLLVWAVIAGLKTTPVKMGPVKKLMAILSAPLFGYFSGSLTISTVVPLVATFIAGAESELRYTVEKVSAAGTRRCRNPIQLADMPIFNSDRCGLSAAFKYTFAPEDPIIVIGRGTAWGVFPSSARHSE